MVEANLWIRFVLAVLATWRVTHLLASEDGPADLIVRLRARLGPSLPGRLMDCFNCLSLWIAAPAALAVSRRPLDWLLAWLAVSGAASLLERVGSQPTAIESIAPPSSPWSQGNANSEGDDSDVLRTETISASEYAHTDDGGAGNADDGHAAAASVAESLGRERRQAERRRTI